MSADANRPYVTIPEGAEEGRARADRVLEGVLQEPDPGDLGGGKDVIALTVKKAGDYLWFCGVPGHGLSGMWVYFKVSADADRPYATVAADAERGRS